MRTVIYIYLLFFTYTLGYSQVDKLASLRTAKQIHTIENIVSDYYTIQILALKKPPTNPTFFTNLEDVKEFKCSDSFVRYTVGEFPTFDNAKSLLDQIRSQGYPESFITNTRSLGFKEKVESSVNKNGRFTIQLTALRYPVYLTYFKDITDVKEYYMKDKIYRYCVGDFSWNEGVNELDSYRNKGYTGAHLVSLDNYEPYLIE